jgi:hypothetical protein
VRHALADGTLCELADALGALETPPRVEGFTGYFPQLVAEARFSEIPALFTLCSDADMAALDDGLWTSLAMSAAPAAVRFAYEGRADTAVLRRHAERAYALGLSARDRALVRLACERGGARLRPEDARPLLDDALEETDVAWFDFAVGRLGALPAPDPDRAQLFLAHQSRSRPDRAARDAELLGVTADPALGQWLLDLTDGRFAPTAAPLFPADGAVAGRAEAGTGRDRGRGT